MLKLLFMVSVIASVAWLLDFGWATFCNRSQTPTPPEPEPNPKPDPKPEPPPQLKSDWLQLSKRSK